MPHNQTGHDPLHKIHPVFDFVMNKFKQVFYPGQSLTNDERISPLCRHVTFHVFIQNKPNKYGLMFYVLSMLKQVYSEHCEKSQLVIKGSFIYETQERRIHIPSQKSYVFSTMDG